GGRPVTGGDARVTGVVKPILEFALELAEQAPGAVRGHCCSHGKILVCKWEARVGRCIHDGVFAPFFKLFEAAGGPCRATICCVFFGTEKSLKNPDFKVQM